MIFGNIDISKWLKRICFLKVDFGRWVTHTFRFKYIEPYIGSCENLKKLEKIRPRLKEDSMKSTGNQIHPTSKIIAYNIYTL